MRTTCIAALLLATLTVVAGCGRAVVREVTPPPPRGVLEVVNRTAIDWEIASDGWTLGQVPAGERRRFRDLRPRTARLTAWAAGYHSKEVAAELRRGEVAVWELLPPLGAGSPLATPPPFGAITLVNTSARDIDFRLDDGPTRTLIAGDSRRLPDVPAGIRHVHLSAPGTRYTREIDVTVTGGDELRVETPLATGTIELTNRTGEAVRVLVDGIEGQRVADDTETRLPSLVVGVHQLRAVGVTSGKEHLRTVRVTEDETLPWDLTASRGRLVLTNRTGDLLTVRIDDAARGELADGKSIELDDVPLGLRHIVATGRSTGFRWSADVPLNAGHVSSWTLRDDAGTAFLDNHLTEVIQLRRGDELLARIEPGEALFLDELRAGSQKLTVFGERSRTLDRRSLTISPARTAFWRVATPQARVHVRNQKPEPVVVYADQRPLGRVPAGGEVIFTQVPPGNRLLEARGEESEHVTRSRRELRLDAIVVWDVEESTGQVHIANRSGETLTLPPALRPQAPEVRDGQDITVRVPIGHRIVHLVGKRSNQSYFKRLTIRTAAIVDWEIGRLSGMLEVFNRTAEVQRVHVDNDPPFDVAPRRMHSIALPAGAHRLVAVGGRTGNAHEGTVVVRARASHPWEVTPSRAHLRITNSTRETLDLRRDGGTLGRVGPGESATFGPWAPKTYTINAQGRWSRAIYEARIELVGGRVERWEVHPARGSIRVLNRRDEAVRVLVGGEPRAVVPANSEAALESPLGSHMVELIGQTSLAIFTHRLRVRPDRTYAIEAPAGPAVLVVRNELSLPLAIQLESMDRGLVEPGAELRIPLRRMGEVTVHALLPDGRIRWHRRLDVKGDEVYRWVVKP